MSVVPTLLTERLLLRPMHITDVDPLLHIFGDPKVMDVFDSAPFDRAQMTGWVRRNLEHQEQHGYGLFAVVLRGPGLLIGDCGLEHMELAGRPEVELGFDFRSDYWNQGYASEAAIAVRDFALHQLQLPRLVSLIRYGNTASQRVATKIGMRQVDEITRGATRYVLYATEQQSRLV